MIKRINFITLSFLAIVTMLCLSCKKVLNNKPDMGENNGWNDNYLGNYTISNSSYDTLYLYAKAFYYWNSALPTFQEFNPIKYRNADSLLGLKNELFAYTQIAIYDSTHLPYEYPSILKPGEPKYSYIENTSDDSNGGNSNIVTPNRLAITLDGKGNDNGINFGFYGTTSAATGKDTTITTIKYVVNGSPAQKAGLKRGDIIYKMNDQAIDFDLFGNDDDRNNYYYNLLVSNSLTVVTIDSLYPKSQKRRQTTYKMGKALYNVNPVFKDTVLTLPNGNHVAYIAFETFTNMSNAKTYLDAAFSKFQSANVSDIVIDLRYNGGGSVETATYFANNLIPNGNNGKTLFVGYYNNALRRQTMNEQSNYPQSLKDILSTQKMFDDNGNLSSALNIDYSIEGNTEKINKVGSFNLSNKRLFFIVAGGTASASELLINSLKPYTNVTLIGARYAEPIDNSTGKKEIRTYGKPIAFFDLNISSYTVYMSMFETRNANNQGGYYSGLLTDSLGEDDITADFGSSKDPNESLNLILGNIDPKYSVSSVYPRLNKNQLKVKLNAELNTRIRSYEKSQLKQTMHIMVAKPKFKD